ncbi:MAG: hypothetical protein H0T76_22160 [Nannocystis sp.]|nr:hypothetical protein [Nannocystis sp.]MBA3549186.1 hypothetical protein [Nannocystis sp.]
MRPDAEHALSPQTGPGVPRGRAWLALLLLALGYAALRLAMNREFEGAPWDQLLDFSAAKPFGLRVLVPLLAWPLHTLLRLPASWVFGLFETLATVGLALAVGAALRPFVPGRWASGLGVLFILLLPIPFLLQHRWPIFYPYDTPAMAFTAGGVALLLRGRWRAAALLCFFAALNRESAALLPVAALALHWRRSSEPVPQDISSSTLSIRQLLARTLGLAAAVALARLAVAILLKDNPGAPLQWFVDTTPRLLANLAWLESPAHWLLIPAYLGFIPLAWLLVTAAMPPHLRRLGGIALAYLGALMWVANIDEPRVYGEAMVLLYLPAAVGLQRWLQPTAAAV